MSKYPSSSFQQRHEMDQKSKMQIMAAFFMSTIIMLPGSAAAYEIPIKQVLQLYHIMLIFLYHFQAMIS